MTKTVAVVCGGVGAARLCLFQVGQGVGGAAEAVLERPAVEPGGREARLPFQAAVVVGQGRLRLAGRLAGQGAVVVARGGLGRQRDADVEGRRRLPEPAEAVGANALVEVRPELAGQVGDGPVEVRRGLGGPAGRGLSLTVRSEGKAWRRARVGCWWWTTRSS